MSSLEWLLLWDVRTEVISALLFVEIRYDSSTFWILSLTQIQERQERSRTYCIFVKLSCEPWYDPSFHVLMPASQTRSSHSDASD